jgi:pimeloyl-ACP methyl ester carboxylesterase
MTIVGEGPPLVLVPGLQGRWEWMAPTVNALAQSFRVATFSLCGEPEAPGLGADFDAHLAQVDAAIDALGGAPAFLVGISYGGWVAVRYAARRSARVRGLVIASTPGPGFELTPRFARWVRAPRLSFPEFVLTSPGRLFGEVCTARGGVWNGLRFLAAHMQRGFNAPMSATRAAVRLRLALQIDYGDMARAVRAPTLVVSGEDALDRLVPPSSTRAWADDIRGARLVCLERTGHIGTMTRPERFAEIVGSFAASAIERDTECGPSESLKHERSSVA